MKKSIILLVSINLLQYGFCYGQIMIKGKVIGQNQELLQNATLKTLWNNKYIKLDKGYFSIPVPSFPKEVEISNIGYQTKVIQLSKADSIYNVQLSLIDQRLDEVQVSTGYQRIPKERATGAFETVDIKQFNQSVNTNVLERIEGLATSVQFDRTTMGGQPITIRGASSISGPRDILVIVDNFPFEGDINTINPNEIESITFLKDAAASSIWGTRAGNGVIVLTTKKGKFDSKLKSSFKISYLLGNRINLDNIPILSNKDYIEFERFKFDKGYKIAEITDPSRPQYASQVYELLLDQQAGKLSELNIENRLNNLSENNLRKEYEQNVYSRKNSRQISWDITSGNAKSAWMASIQRDDSSSELLEKTERSNISLSGQFKPWKTLELSLRTAYTQNKITSGKDGYDSDFANYYSLFTKDGAAAGYSKSYRQQFLDTLGNGYLKDWNYYPLNDYLSKVNLNKLDHVMAQASLSYTIWNLLKLSSSFQYEKQKGSGRFSYGRDSYFARDLVNSYSQIKNGSILYIVPDGGILDLEDTNLEVVNFRLQADLNKEWGKNKLSALAGFEVRERKTEGYYLRRYGYSDEYNTYLNYDPTNRYPNIITGSSSLIPTNDGQSDGNNRFLSTFLNASYVRNEKYIVSLSARRDASNLFGLNVNDKWNLLWSMGAAWHISKESWFPEELINSLKLRATYGFSGNVDPSRSAVTTMIYGLQNQYVNLPIGTINQYANPDLKWEKVKTTNIGIDYSLLKGRINGSIDLFEKISSDLFSPVEMDYTSGVNGTIIKNSGKLSGKGLDFNLHSRILSTQKFKWDISLLLSYYKDQLKEYYLDPNFSASTIVTTSTPIYNKLVGKPLYSMYSYRMAGLDPSNGDPIGYLGGAESKDYQSISSNSNFDDLKYSGSSIPTVFGSLTNVLSFGSWDVTIRLQYNLGYYFRRNTVDYQSMMDRPISSHPDYLLRWRKGGDELQTDIPSFQYPVLSERVNLYRYSEKTVERGDHIRLQHISVGRNVKIGKLECFCRMNGDQLGIIWRKNKRHIDPVYQNSQYVPPAIWSLTAGINF